MINLKLSVIIPCYNEALSVNEFYNTISEELKNEKLTYELIFINDGSTDDTINILKDINKKDKNIKIIDFSRNFGKESAMLAGLENASGDYISIIDADLQQEPRLLISMLQKLIKNPDYDVVCAYRENRYEESSLKSFLVPLFYKIINKVSDVSLLPGASDFRVFESNVKDAIISLKESKRFLKGIFSWVGFNTIYVPYTPLERKYGTSKWSIVSLIKYALNGIISFSVFPLSLIFIIGLMFLIIAILNLLTGQLSTRTIILLLSLILFFIGILSLYISRIYNNSLQRPNYIVKEKIGFTQKKDK